jgi:hypothetical protein
MESLPIPKFTARITVFDVRLDMSCGTQCTRLPTGLAKRVDSAGDQRRLARGKQEKAIHSEMRFHHIVYSHRVFSRRLSESLTQGIWVRRCREMSWLGATPGHQGAPASDRRLGAKRQNHHLENAEVTGSDAIGRWSIENR